MINYKDAVVIVTAALIANPERYKYISEKIKQGELTHEQATEKNVNKACLIVDCIENCVGRLDPIEER